MDRAVVESLADMGLPNAALVVQSIEDWESEASPTGGLDIVVHRAPDHRWSGWPGAWCLDCGIEDPHEVCLATHDWDFGGPNEDGTDGYIPCSDHVRTACPEPGSNAHNPYWTQP